MNNKLNHRAQTSLAEYAALIAVAVAALLALQLYNQRAMQSVIKESFDKIGGQKEVDRKTDRAGIPVVNLMGEHKVSLKSKSKKDYTIETVREPGDDARPEWRQDIIYNDGENKSWSEGLNDSSYKIKVYGGYSEEITNP